MHFVSGALCLLRATRRSPPYFPRRPPSLHRIPSASVRRLLRYYDDATTAATAFVYVSFPSHATYCIPAVLCVSAISDSCGGRHCIPFLCNFRFQNNPNSKINLSWKLSCMVTITTSGCRFLIIRSNSPSELGYGFGFLLPDNPFIGQVKPSRITVTNAGQLACIRHLPQNRRGEQARSSTHARLYVSLFHKGFIVT